MRKRLLCLGLLAAVSQLFATGCFVFHPVAHWRANHPCGVHSHSHPLLHPIQTRRAAINEGAAGTSAQAGPTVGPVVGMAPCHGCAPTTGYPVGLNGGPVTPGDLVPVTHPPTIGYPTPIVPGGPTVVPSYELPHPMPVKPPGQ